MPEALPAASTSRRGINPSKFMGATHAAGKILEKRVGNNEKKITLLKRIIVGRKDGPSIGDKIKGGSSLDQSIQNITNTVTNISETLKNRHQWEKEQAKKEGIDEEQAARDKKEKGSEAKAFTALKKTSQKVLKPVQSIFDKILGVIKKLILGKVVMELFKWFTDKKNQGKVETIVKFFKDWWPTLLAGYLLFGNALGRFVVGLLAKVGVWVATSIPVMIKALAAALAKLKAMKWLKLLGGRRSMRALQLASAVGGTSMILTGNMPSQREDNQGDQGGEEQQTQNQGEQQQTQNQGGEQTQFSMGGFVSGPAGVDRVPAKLTAGEFVMSKGAVQKYGEDTLAGMNAAAGGTNRPTAGGGYQEGGLVEKFKLQYPNLSTGQIQEVIDRQKNIMNTPKDPNRYAGVHPLLRPKPSVDSRSLNERVADALHVDYGSSSTSVDINLPGLQGLQGAQGTQGQQGKMGAGGKSWWDPLGVFTGKDKKEPPGQPITKKTKAAVVAAGKPDASKITGASGSAEGDKIPPINPAAKRSMNKVKTLGISV